jgi:CubicO group peptidase (beta-lactamase class C family)
VGFQLYVSRRGEVLADAALGEARPGVPMTPETLMVWFSAGKPLAAVAIAQLWERGRLALDDPVARHVPEFGQRGKAAVSLRHVLTHTGGFLRQWHWAEYAGLSWDETIARICAAELEPGWVPGLRAGYHPASGWFMLGEVVRRLDGRPYQRYVREAICRPLGMTDTWVGMPVERHRAYGDRIGLMHDTSTPGGPRPYPAATFDAEAACARCNPGERARGPAHDLGRFYELLLGEGEHAGTRLLRPQTVAALTAAHRVGLVDETFGYVKNWGLGFALDNHRPAQGDARLSFGPTCSRRTFGHAGWHSSLGFADPEHGVVLAAVANGTAPNEISYRRFHELVAAVYEDLGIRPESAGVPTRSNYPCLSSP